MTLQASSPVWYNQGVASQIIFGIYDRESLPASPLSFVVFFFWGGGGWMEGSMFTFDSINFPLQSNQAHT